jgi:NADPH:quinone reductase-like Zn-dependent oxidoreductase
MSLSSLSAHLSSIKTAFPPIVSEALFALGLASAAVWTLRPLLTLASRLFGPLFRRTPYKTGDWAVVTGASDGIGEALAMTLAKRGLNVMLIARSKEKLNKVQAAILAATASKVQVAVHVADFSKLDIYADIEKGELLYMFARVV